MLEKQQGTSRAFMVEDDMPPRRKVTRKITNKTGQEGGHTGVSAGYDDTLSLSAKELVHKFDDFFKADRYPRVGCMPDYHSHPGKRGCHRMDLPHRNDTIQAMGGVEAYQRVHTAPPPPQE